MAMTYDVEEICEILEKTIKKNPIYFVLLILALFIYKIIKT